jgi:hypothetical protein
MIFNIGELFPPDLALGPLVLLKHATKSDLGLAVEVYRNCLNC